MAVKREDGQVLIEKIVYHLVFIFQTFAILNNHYDFCHFIHTFSFASSFLNIISEVTATVGLCGQYKFGLRTARRADSLFIDRVYSCWKNSISNYFNDVVSQTKIWL